MCSDVAHRKLSKESAFLNSEGQKHVLQIGAADLLQSFAESVYWWYRECTSCYNLQNMFLSFKI
ncbi:hypothetical protein BpHYR1_006347 [Brachionus plicatilis]|uniref:Uncharacterized protein n=1 Tax=Brachionus plicatilis TaxID=10195 RepID=A0A3M7RIE4_BRAPC|nr:hypothetical protein BpHYR1_006347 [Brachionus plicatilis]